MCSGSTASFVALLVPLSLFTSSCAGSGDDTTPTRYRSPKEVFNAYRQARDKREWRKLFSLLTPKSQNDAVFESFFACGVRDSNEDRDILKKYGVDVPTLTKVLKDEYKAKHGVYPDDDALVDFLDKEYGAGAAETGAAQSDTKSEPLPGATKRDVMSNILSVHVTDKAGFFDAVGTLSERKPVSPLGDLEELVIHGDVATGRAATPSFHYETPPGKPPQKVEDTVYKTFRFRRIGGGWLVD